MHLQLECLIECHYCYVSDEKKMVEKKAFLEVRSQKTSEDPCLRHQALITGTHKQSCRTRAPWSTLQWDKS